MPNPEISIATPMGNRWRTVVLSAILATFGSAAALAANAPFPTVTTPVQLDGSSVGDPVWNRVLNTIVYANGGYHMWYVGGDYLFTTGIGYATSTDGVNFTSVGTVKPPANWWVGGGATQEPLANYLRVSRDSNGDWILMIWHPSGAGQGAYNYNTSLWNLGSIVSNLNPSQIGPLPSQPGGNHVGPYGIVGSNLYLGQDTPGAFGRYALPIPGPVSMPDAANAYAGTGLCSFAVCPGDPNSSYIHNYGRTLDQGINVLGTYYSLRNFNDFTRRDKNLWYMESTDGGSSWSNASPLFTNGAAVTVDGLPNTGNFGLPEVAALGGGQYRSYFNTADACGNYVTVTASLPGQERGLSVTKSFSPSAVVPGGESVLTVTLSAPAATCTPAPASPVYTGVGFNDALPAGMTVANAPAASTTCPSGSVTAIGGANSFSLNNTTLAAGASCTVSVRVTVAGTGTFRNVIRVGAIVNGQGVPAVADAVADLRSDAIAATPVSTLGDLALIALGLLLAAFGSRRLRATAAH